MPDYIKLTTIKNLIDRANTDGCPTTRELYRQMAINEARQINVTLTPEHFPAFTEKTPSVPEENAVINAGNEKIEVPNALPEYPGSCPVCGLLLRNNMAWISHKKAHTR